MTVEDPAVLAGTAAWSAVEAFYRRETLLLQDRRYREWLTLFDERITYRVPTRTATPEGLVSGADDLGYYDEDYALLDARVAKLESRQSWVENPPSRLRYFVQLLECTPAADGTLVARTNLLLLQSRWNLDQQFSGERRDTFVDGPSGLRLRERLVLLDREHLGSQGLSVFF